MEQAQLNVFQDETPEIKIKTEKHKVHGYNEVLDNRKQF